MGVDSAGTLKILRTLINAGLDVKTPLPCAGTMADATVLMVAAKSGFAKVCGQMIAASADLEAKDAAGRTALMHAVLKESPEVVRVLFDARADASAQDAKGFTPSDDCALVAESGAPRDIAGRTGEEEGAESTAVRDCDDPLGRYRPASCSLLSRVTRALPLSLSPLPLFGGCRTG